MDNILSDLALEYGMKQEDGQHTIAIAVGVMNLGPTLPGGEV